MEWTGSSSQVFSYLNILFPMLRNEFLFISPDKSLPSDLSPSRPKDAFYTHRTTCSLLCSSKPCAHTSIGAFCRGALECCLSLREDTFVSCCPLHFQDPGQCPIIIGIQGHSLWESIIKRGKNEKPSEKEKKKKRHRCVDGCVFKIQCGRKGEMPFLLKGDKIILPLIWLLRGFCWAKNPVFIGKLYLSC